MITYIKHPADSFVSVDLAPGPVYVQHDNTNILSVKQLSEVPDLETHYLVTEENLTAISNLSGFSTYFPGNDLSVVWTTEALLYNRLYRAMDFGNKLIADFAKENILLGITQAGKTRAVRQATSDVLSALSTGSLYDAIVSIREIPAESKDLVFITDARLLAFINEIETYLGLSLSTEL